MKKVAAGMLAALAMGGGVLIAAPSATALPPTYGNAKLVDSCPGRVVASGSLADDNGVAHSRARWTLSRAGGQGGTYCLRVADRMAGPHIMTASLSNDSSGAYTSSMFDEATQGALVYRARRTMLTVSAAIHGDDGTVYRVDRTITGR